MNRIWMDSFGLSVEIPCVREDHCQWGQLSRGPDNRTLEASEEDKSFYVVVSGLSQQSLSSPWDSSCLYPLRDFACREFYPSMLLFLWFPTWSKHVLGSGKAGFVQKELKIINTCRKLGGMIFFLSKQWNIFSKCSVPHAISRPFQSPVELRWPRRAL